MSNFCKSLVLPYLPRSFCKISCRRIHGSFCVCVCFLNAGLQMRRWKTFRGVVCWNSLLTVQVGRQGVSCQECNRLPIIVLEFLVLALLSWLAFSFWLHKLSWNFHYCWVRCRGMLQTSLLLIRAGCHTSDFIYLVHQPESHWYIISISTLQLAILKSPADCLKLPPTCKTAMGICRTVSRCMKLSIEWLLPHTD